MQIEKFELLLFGDNRDQRVHAPISPTFKPFLFPCNGEALQPVGAIVSEGLQKLLAICCSGYSLLNVQRVQAAAKGDDLRSKFEKLAAVLSCRAIDATQVGDFEVL